MRRLDLLPVYAVFFVLFLYGPMLLMPLFSFNDANFATFPLKGFTARHYAGMGSNTSMLTALENSLIVGVAVSVVATALALPAALALTRYRVPGGGAILSFMMLPLVVPSIVLAVGLLVVVLRVLGVPLSLWTVAAGHLMLCIPFGMTVLMSRLEGFDRSLEEASRDLGAGGWDTFRRVTLPLAAPGVISSLLLCFIISFDEFVISFFLTGTDNTLPVFLFSQLRFPNRLPGTLALGSLILVGSAALVILAEIVRKRGVASDNPGDL
ncbi:Inner membrane ABC transporter permease protein YdcV [Defluviimonas aquaemixtae]|uniref:Inner membrane ABC transporter permease protein YdcV n=1 Tax=Albidovulum aquaemixtae TaxID=1542388 RepID=A0A2R8B3R7_9RHOB|nr:ABC transporter permease [Defluviimonas aquaemixtae]SPH17258.1 Inner membrane ABC transporter permease protein YdcV [Defluviimonas aquaemixtae]